jgi:hypothetical protein
MRRPTPDRIDEEPWVMGVLEPILLLLVIAITALATVDILSP